MIFNPVHFTAEVEVIDASAQPEIQGNVDTITAIHALEGPVSIGQGAILAAGDTCVFTGQAMSLSD